MKLWKRIVCAGLSAMMLLAPMQAAAAETDGAVEVVTIEAETDLPSMWAFKEVYMAEVYGIGGEIVFNGFKTPMAAENFSVLLAQVFTLLGLEPAGIDTTDALTRGFVINTLYKAAAEALEIDGGDALAFFLDNGLIVGNGSGDYALERVCTTQEAVVFAKRLYEHVARELGLGSTGFLWKVTDEDSAVFLLGSVHVADYAMYPLSKAIMDAYEASAAVVVEVSASELDVQLVSEIIMEYGFYTDGTKLVDVVGEEAYAKIVAFTTALGLAEENISNARPWYIEQILTANVAGNYTATGIDMFCMLLASLDGKPVYALESAASQIAVLASLSEEAQKTRLLASLSETEEDMEASVKSMLAAWRDGDEEAMLAILGRDEITDEASLEFYEKFNTERNAEMIETIAQVLTENEDDVIVIVGTLHMLYEDGIVQAMRDLGFAVERVQ